MLIPCWTVADAAPKDPKTLNAYLTEALAFAAQARGHCAFAHHIRRQSMADLFRPLCQRAWHLQSEWEVETFRFWAAFPTAAKDEELVDLFDTVCMMAPLGDLEDENEADAYWPDLVATLRGLGQLALS